VNSSDDSKYKIPTYNW